MEYKYCGKSGLQLPIMSLGLWHNFGDVDDFATATDILCYAFDQGITHFDLANNYGPSPGSAETNFGRIFSNELRGHRDEMIITSKAGHLMWNGPYGDGGSRKYMMASIDQSLKRTGLEYFDVFYSHRYDPQTPIEETIQALIDIVRQGKALYVGISKYPADKAEQAYRMLAAQHVPCIIYQGRYNMLDRQPEAEVMPLNDACGVGFVAFSPLAQGLLTNKYLNGIPENSRAAKASGHLQTSAITPAVVSKLKELNVVANKRNQSLAEMALAWILQRKSVTSVIVGASSVEQLKSNLQAMNNSSFAPDELNLIDCILAR